MLATTSTTRSDTGAAAYRGIRWHYARPPVIGLELEIDGYAARQELVLAP